MAAEAAVLGFAAELGSQLAGRRVHTGTADVGWRDEHLIIDFQTLV